MTDLRSTLLLTDEYQLTMLQGYFDQKMNETAVFELFARKLPPGRNFFVAAGLEQALAFLEQARFTPEELDWLRATGSFRDDFLDYLAKWRFRGDVSALAEGTVFFANEPMLRVTATLPEAQLVESRLINILQFETLIASKAARSVLAAPGKRLVEFGLRRAHGAEAALLAARAAYLVGFAGTSNLLAGMLFGVPTFGTMAHSFVQAHDHETEAFENFARSNPQNVTMLLDTYDTETSAERTVALAQKLRQENVHVRGVRLDSGDLAELSVRVRRILDAGGLTETAIFASGNLDEYELRKLTEAQAPIDGYGIGTRVDVSADAPYLDCAYKLQEYAGVPRRKRSPGKATWPGRKQVYRFEDENGVMAHDVVALEGETPNGETPTATAPRPLIAPVMRAGQRVSPAPTLKALRQQAAENLAGLPARLKLLEPAEPYEVRISPRLSELAAHLDAMIRGG